MEFENKRIYFRVALFFPLSSQMTIIRSRDQSISLGSTEVLIEHIGIGGLRSQDARPYIISLLLRSQEIGGVNG